LTIWLLEEALELEVVTVVVVELVVIVLAQV
jgi:hypothetical protein